MRWHKEDDKNKKKFDKHFVLFEEYNEEKYTTDTGSAPGHKKTFPQYASKQSNPLYTWTD